ncbi:MAG: 2-oxoacid:acceptor oxidoreductase subunit alpha [Methanotrichaceae archaeon]|nr:2-oxoacid:acceptor oxidoreductase subunit alpha [Methanotrichaceae archaeon]
MNSFSVLIGGIAGDGINEAGVLIGHILSHLGYRIFMYYDYPSLIRGGHNFSIVRASNRSIAAHTDFVDLIIAFNQETVDKHKNRLSAESYIVYDSDKVKIDGLSTKSCDLPVSQIIKKEGALPIMRNTCFIGGFCKLAGISWPFLEDVLKKHIPKQIDLNLRIALKGYESAMNFFNIDKLNQPSLPILTGNQAIGLGLIKAGLKAYVAYPMTPSSGLLEFLARNASKFGLKVVHPENEIAVMLMAHGFSHVGLKAAVGTSGGGFCLMTEGLSLAGMAELPVVIMLGQRTGPSTGAPTYTGQGDLHFALNAGQGEFPRFIVSPGDAEEAYFWSGIALNMAWKYQIPAFILSDKSVCESTYSFCIEEAGDLKEEDPILWDGRGKYGRYKFMDSGISPIAFPPTKGQAIKANSYAHDEYGITTEDPKLISALSDKRILKEKSLSKELENYETVKVYGSAKTALLTWGSNKGVCIEAAEKLGLEVIQLLVLAPFPTNRLTEALQDLDKVVAVECNSTGQVARLAACNGIQIDDKILKYDGRPISLEDLEIRLRGVQV